MIDNATTTAQLVELLRAAHGSIFWGDRLLTMNKSAGFLKDPNFQEAVVTADLGRNADEYNAPHGIAWRFHTLIWAAQQSLHLAGDLVECGTFRGNMMGVVIKAVDLPSAGKELYLFDTFAGFDKRLPEPPHYDTAQPIFASPNIYADIVSRFENEPYIKVIEGSVLDTLTVSAPQQICFLHLDMNSAEAEWHALEMLYPRLSPGAPIVFDDYGWALFHGQKESADRFMAKHNLTILELPTGQGLAIK